MIVTRKLSKVYPGDVVALDSVTVAVPHGDFVFLVGPNGAGKTTLFKILIKEELPSDGCVLVDGRDVRTLRSQELARHRREVGAVFQDPRLIPSKTVFENVALPLETEHFESQIIKDRTEASLFLTGLESLSLRFPSDLSGGQRQQVAIARALANQPRVILADEPTGNLSPSATHQIMRLLSVINECGITVIVATHNYEIVDSMTRRVLALDGGKLVFDTSQSGYPAFLRRKAA